MSAATVTAFVVGFLITGLIVAGFLYGAHRRAETAHEWWKACTDALDLPVDLKDAPDSMLPGSTFQAEGRIADRPLTIRQSVDGFASSQSDDVPKVRYKAEFEFEPLPFEFENHLDADDPVSLRTGMPRLDQQSVVKTTSPVAALRTFEYEGIPGKLYRAAHLGDGWQLDNGRLTVHSDFAHSSFNPLNALIVNVNVGPDPASPTEAAQNLATQMRKGADFCNQLEEAQKPRDVYWRPRTILGKAWKSVAESEGLDFACSECRYEDAAIEGNWGDREIVAHTEGKGDRPVSRMVVTMQVSEKPYEIDFGVSGRPGAAVDRDELLGSIARGEHDLSTDDKGAGFDRVYDIRGDRISAYGNLGRPGVETALLKLYRPGIDISIEANELRLTLENPPDTESGLRSLLSDTSTLADALEGKTTDHDILETLEHVDAAAAWQD